MPKLAKVPQILVTGATGFIGVPLCQKLQTLGYGITALTRNPVRARNRLGAGMDLVSDLADLEDKHFGAAINLAGEPLVGRRWTEERKRKFRASRIETTRALLAYFQRLNDFPEVLVNGSAVGYYGNQGKTPITEENDVSDQSFSAQLCHDWEAEAERFSAFGTRVCRLRTGLVLGPDGGALKLMLPAFKAGLGGRLGRGRQWMSWIHRDDLIGIILLCLLDKDISGPVNGTSPNPVTNRVFTRMLAKAVGRPALFRVPAVALRLALGDAADELLLTSQRILPQVAPAHGYTYRYPDLGQALDEILSH